MTVAEKLRGVFAYPVTPSTPDGRELDEGRLQELLDFLIESRVHGITVVGSTGSFGSFTESERRRIAEIALKHVGKRVPVFVGTGSVSTDEAIRLSKHAEASGAAGLQVVAMSHWPLTNSELYNYYRDIASAVSLPVLVHNVPALTGMDLEPPLLARLAEIENLRLVKEGSGELVRIARLRRLTTADVQIWHDQDVTAIAGLLSGAVVWTPVVSAIMPRECVELYEFVTRGELGAAQRLFDRMFPLIDFLSRTGAVRALHTAFDLMGAPVGPPRKPLQPLEPDDRAELAKLLAAVGLLSRRASAAT